MNSFEHLWRQRYGDDAGLPAASDPGALLAQLLSHRTVRAYTAQPLPPDTLPLMMAAAQSASTSSNLQTWSVVAVEDPARKARLAKAAASQAHIVEAPLLLVWLADLSRLDRTAARRDTPADANDYLEMFLVAAIDAALAAQNAVVAAEALGLGTSYIGAMRNRPEDVAAELTLPPHVFAVFGLTVGHPDPQRPASIKPRLPQSVMLHRETYAADDEIAHIGAYDASIQAFQRGQAMREQAWSLQSTQRVAGPSSLSGRDRLVEAIRDRGFGLK